jgi:hypothetical protein
MFSYIFDYSYWLQAFCLLSAWLLLILFAVNLWNTLIEIIQKSRTMHQIPCHSCQYFTDSYNLKCTIHPTIANTELAINCRDFQQ